MDFGKTRRRSKEHLPFGSRFGIDSTNQDTGARTLDDKFHKRLIKIVAELLAIALTVVLLQLFIDWVGFLSAWPILAIALVVLVIIIATMRKQ